MPTACFCTVAKYENEPLSHLHCPFNAELDSKTKLLCITCTMCTWQWPLKTFNWVALGAEAIKLHFIKVTLTGQNSVVYLRSRILYEWIRKYCQTKWEDQPPAKWKCFFKKRLCIVQNYGRVKSIKAAPLLLFIYNEATRSITWHKFINKFLEEILECLLVWRDLCFSSLLFPLNSFIFH